MSALRFSLSVALLSAPGAAMAGGKVTICHATGSASNPYSEIEISENAWSKGTGHGAHSSDFEIPTWYADADGDGFGVPSDTVESCEQPSGYVDDASDCDDRDGSVYPYADEGCDDLDNDCDGDVDEGGTLVSATASGLVGIDLDSSSSTWTVASTGWGSTMQGVAGSVESDLVYASNKAGEIYEVDLDSGAAVQVADVGAIKVCGMAIGPDGGVYYLSRTYGTLNQLDPTDGTSTTVGSLGVSLATCGLTYSPEEDAFYVLNRRTLLTVDPDDGSVLDSNALSGMSGNSAGVAWSCADDTVYTQTFSGVFEVDLDRNRATRVHTFGDDSITFVSDD